MSGLLIGAAIVVGLLGLMAFVDWLCQPSPWNSGNHGWPIPPPPEEGE